MARSAIETRLGNRPPRNLAGTGPANIRSFLVRACCYDCLIALIDPFLPVNQGSAGWWKPAFAGARSCTPTTPSR